MGQRQMEVNCRDRFQELDEAAKLEYELEGDMQGKRWEESRTRSKLSTRSVRGGMRWRKSGPRMLGRARKEGEGGRASSHVNLKVAHVFQIHQKNVSQADDA